MNRLHFFVFMHLLTTMVTAIYLEQLLSLDRDLCSSTTEVPGLEEDLPTQLWYRKYIATAADSNQEQQGQKK